MCHWIIEKLAPGKQNPIVLRNKVRTLVFQGLATGKKERPVREGGAQKERWWAWWGVGGSCCNTKRFFRNKCLTSHCKALVWMVNSQTSPTLHSKQAPNSCHLQLCSEGIWGMPSVMWSDGYGTEWDGYGTEWEAQEGIQKPNKISRWYSSEVRGDNGEKCEIPLKSLERQWRVIWRWQESG